MLFSILEDFMHSTTYRLLTLCVAPFAVICTWTNCWAILPQCGIPAVEPWRGNRNEMEPQNFRVVGGTAARPHSWTWQCGIVHRGHSSTTCGCTVVARRWVLTAAHCRHVRMSRLPLMKQRTIKFAKVYELLPKQLSLAAAHCRLQNDLSKYRIVAGKHKLLKSRKTDQVAYIRRVIVHQKFNAKTFDNDVALIELDREFTFNNYVRPICLATVDFPAGSTCVISGWGKTEGTGDNSVLREAWVPILSHEQCERFIGWWNLSPNMLCAGFAILGRYDTCQGDSGGPLACQSMVNGRWYQLGITSFGSGCAEPYSPGVYVKVTRYIEWIREQLDLYDSKT